MTRNKIPIWENKKDYSADIDVIACSLLTISDREYQLRVWYRAEGPEVDWFEECLLNFDTEMDSFRHLLRKGETSLEPSQVRAILRVHIMTSHFCSILSRERENMPKGWSDGQLYIINHPYWQKMQKQAAYALSLLKNDNVENKPPRTYGSIETRTATRHPKLDDRFGDKMKVFADPQVQAQWKNIDDFWDSVHGFDDIFNRFFDGGGMISSRWHYKAMMAFNKALDELCKPYEGNDAITVEHILSDPRLHEVEQKAQNFLKINEERSKAPKTSFEAEEP